MGDSKLGMDHIGCSHRLFTSAVHIGCVVDQSSDAELAFCCFLIRQSTSAHPSAMSIVGGIRGARETTSAEPTSLVSPKPKSFI